MNLFVLFLMGLLPILWLVIALCVIKIPSHFASLGALLIAIVEAMLLWHMPFIYALTAALEGIAMALWPIILVIIAAIFTYNVTVKSGAMLTIKNMISSISNDKRILVILIGWCFGGFLEGVAGFGTAVAIPVGMLFALGFDPIESIVLCLIANAFPTMFGSIGIPTTTLATVTHLNSTALATAEALQASLFLFATPFIMVCIASKTIKGIKDILPILLTASLSFVVPECIVATFVGADLPVLVGAVCSLLCTIAVAILHTKKNPTPTEYCMDIAQETNTLHFTDAIIAWSPYLIIFAILLLTSNLVPFIHNPLSAIHSTANIYVGDPDATLTFTWICTPGVLIFLSGFVGGRIQGCSWKDLFITCKETLIQMSKTIVTMCSVMGCAKVMGYSGMISDIANFFVSTLGTYYPMVAPIIGGLGTFVTGSATSSAVLFGNVQTTAATAIQADPTWIAAANGLGTSIGKLMSPQTIAIGAAACGLKGKDGEILKRVAPLGGLYVILCALVVFFGMNLWA